jgi:hypothetical protein
MTENRNPKHFMKVASPPGRITSVHFRERARYYRLAAAIADAPRDVATFCDLAMMFERLAEDFARGEVRSRSLSSAVDRIDALSS